MFPKKYDDNYRSINAGSHHKPSSIVGVPALVQHLAYWRPSKREQDAWIEAIDRRLYIIYIHLKDSLPLNDIWTNAKEGERLCLFHCVYGIDKNSRPFDAPLQTKCNPNDPNRQSNDYQVIQYVFKWHGIEATIRSELHLEFFTMTVILDMSYTDDKANASGDEKINELCKTYKELNHLINSEEQKKSALSTIHDFLYETIWDNFHAEILCPPGYTDYDGSKDHKAIGTIFADFRILLTGSAQRKEEDKCCYSVFSKSGSTLLFRSPFEQSDDKGCPPEDPFVQVEEFDNHNNEAKKVITRLWPFLTSKKGLDLHEYEFTACLMSNRHLIYATAMGPQPYNNSAISPLFAFHYWNTNNRWQIGRMVDRLNYAGTMRLASIKDIDKLIGYARELHTIQHTVENARDSNELGKKLEDLQKSFKLANNLIDHGVNFRIHRSRYYVRQLKYTLKALRLENGRIEGYQPYDEFLFRRLGPAFEFIDRLGIRYDQAKKDIADLVQFNLAKSSLVIQEEIFERNNAIKNLQTTGEDALFLVLLPYYTSNITIHAFHLEDSHYSPLVWIFQTTAIWGFYATRRNAHKAKNVTGLNVRIKKIVTAFIFVLGLAFLILFLH
jgi:hypothetical protein